MCQVNDDEHDYHDGVTRWYMRARINNASSCRSKQTAHKYPWNVDGSDDLVVLVDRPVVIVQRSSLLEVFV